MEDLKVKKQTNLAKPKKYLVTMLNDEYSTFEIVEFILQKYFNKTVDESKAIATEIHKNNEAVVGGPYTLEVAESKVLIAMQHAKAFEYPLQLKIVEG